MAYNYIPTSAQELTKHNAFKYSPDYVLVYNFLWSKFKKKDPIALSTLQNEKKNIKISRGFQGVISLDQVKSKLKLKHTKVTFGEGSRGGRGVANKGAIFERHLTDDFNTWWEDETKYKTQGKKVIEEIAKQYKWDKVKKFKAEQVGGVNTPRPLQFSGKDVFVGTTGDQNIGNKVTDITCTADGKDTYLSLKATGTVTFFNAGVMKWLREDDMKKGTVSDSKGLALLNIMGIDPKRFADVFNSFGSNKNKVIRYNEPSKFDKKRLIQLIKSGIGYGYHYIHAKKPNEIYHFQMTKKKMEDLAQPTKGIIYYGGNTARGKRIDVEIDTPFIALKFNIRNKQGGIYPSHIMCDYTFKRYK